MGGGQNEINARHLQTEVGVEVEDELGKNTGRDTPPERTEKRKGEEEKMVGREMAQKHTDIQENGEIPERKGKKSKENPRSETEPENKTPGEKV